MKYLKRFNENRIIIYEDAWKNLLPDDITLYKGQEWGVDKVVYQRGNIMMHSDMIQITYFVNKWTYPDNLEFDFYFVKDDEGEEHIDITKIINSDSTISLESSDVIKNLRIDVDITFGEQMACEFSIDKDGVHLIEETSVGSKFDPSNTVFAIDDESINNFINIFNRFDICHNLTLEDFDFLRFKG